MPLAGRCLSPLIKGCLGVRPITVFVAALWVATGAGMRASESDLFTVGVRFDIDRSIEPRVVVRDVQDEAESLWRPYGVHVNWTGAAQPEAEANGFFMAAIVARRIVGRASESQGILGQATVSLDYPTRQPIVVSFDATERVLALRKNAFDAAGVKIVHTRDMSRALGRVLAHEIGHVLLRAPYHDNVGLMRPHFRANELGEPDRAPFRLSCAAVTRLRSRIQSLTADSHVATAVPDPLAGVEPAWRDGVDRAPCIPGHPGR